MTIRWRRAPAAVFAAVVALVLAAGPSAAGTSEQDSAYDVLVYFNAAGFVHASIPVAVAAFESLAVQEGFEVTSTDDPGVFTDEQLAEFDVVAFVLTTGDAVPEPEQQAAFERWHRAGGAWMGVHSAADTEYDWSYYGELLAGAYFLAHPVQQPGTAIVERQDHPATEHLGETWQFPLEEYYSFVRNPRPDTTVLVSMDESSYEQDPNTSNLDNMSLTDGVSATMGDHPMVWCHDVDGGRAFYTAFGHESYLYADPDFRAHLVGGLDALAGVAEAPCHAAAASASDSGSSAGDGAPDEPTDADGAPSEDVVADDARGGTDDGASRGLAATGGGAATVLLGALALVAAARIGGRRDSEARVTPR
jgi:type 1 glutamine amidotransferase